MTTKLWGQQNCKDAERATWKMGVYRSLRTVVLFKLRWPQKSNGISPLEHSSTSRATGIITWWATSSLLISPLSQMAISSISSRLLIFLCWIHPPFPMPSCSFLSYCWKISWDVLTPGVFQAAGWHCFFWCMGKGWSGIKEVDTERWCSGSEGKCSHALTEHEQKTRIPEKRTHLTIIILSYLLCRGWLAAEIYR